MATTTLQISDGNTAARAARNLVQEFETAVCSHSKQFVRVAWRILRNDDDAEDAVQNALMVAYRALDRFSGRSRLTTWLHRIVVNSALLLRQKRSRHESVLEDGETDTQNHDELGPLERMATAENGRRVRQAIRDLPEAHGRVIALRDLEQKSTEETAALLGIREGAVRTRLHRARAELATQLQRQTSA